MDKLSNTAVLGRWEDFLPTLPDGCIDLVVTDPPYGVTPQSWDRSRPVWIPFMAEMGRLCGDSGQMWIFARMPWSVDVYLAAEKCGWKYVQERIWVKQNAGGCTSHSLLRKMHETILHFKRPEASVFNSDAIRDSKTSSGDKSVSRRRASTTQFLGTDGSRYEDDGTRMPKSIVWCRNVHRTAESVGHPTQKPLAVVEPLILYSSGAGNVVLDPFAGSGTVPVAAARNARRWVACETEKEWHSAMMSRIAAAASGSDKECVTNGLSHCSRQDSCGLFRE